MSHVNGAPLVEAKNLRKSYRVQNGVVHALNGVDITVRTGEFVAVVGPTGSGKSTLLNLLAGLEPADAGTVVLLGHPLDQLDEDALADLRLRAVGMIYQSYNLFSGFTVRQNVRLPLQLMTRRPPFDATQRTNQLLADFGLPDLAERYPAELSGGQQQLAAIARALATNPPLILADEPTANVDTTMARQIVARLRGLANSGQHGVILATHDLRMASQADRVLSLRDGQIVKETVLQPGRDARDVIEALA
ncbi:MAG: ABC transporter ATP-binding protein [Caldilineales bacterium]|nr:ABC transporter ATP-binding protein [Caldilineales bacterium]MDW8318179.1 ABC transporter ATP-binding protein [Anaerolineae bacterium]